MSKRPTAPSLHQHHRGPEHAQEAQPALKSPELSSPVEDTFRAFFEYLQSGAQVDPPALVQKEAFSLKAEADRNNLFGNLERSLGLKSGSISTRLANSEVMWRERGNDAVEADPWMQQVLGVDQPEESTILVPGGARRQAILAVNDNNTVFMIDEFEFPHRIIAPDGVRDNLQRVITFSATQFVVD